MEPFVRRLAGSVLVALFLCFGLLSASAQAMFEKAPLTITTADGTAHDFTIELAADAEQRAQGLMNRHAMAPDHGMLFDFGQTRPVMMWMKNTYLPLDMLFIAKDGKVATIRENAEVLSTAIIDSGVPVAFVLELNAGTVKRLGIRRGDVVEATPIAKARQ